MASRKEERAQLRQLREEKEADQRRRQRKRMTAAYCGAAFLVIVIGAAAIFGLLGQGGDGSNSAHVSLQSGQTNGIAVDERYGIEPKPVQQPDLQLAASAAGCEVMTRLPIEGRSHLSPNASTPKYRTNPPTSGNHIEPPYQQADGAYAETPPEVNVVHSLEHGRVAVQYSTSLSAEDQRALRGVYDNAYSAALLFPNDSMPFDVAVSSWGEMLGCLSYQGDATLDAIRAFGARYQGTAPEPIEAFGPLAGPTFVSSAPS